MEKPFKKRVSRCSKVEASFSTEKLSSDPHFPNFNSDSSKFFELSFKSEDHKLRSQLTRESFERFQTVANSLQKLLTAYPKLLQTL